jgi:hypothetical protein
MKIEGAGHTEQVLRIRGHRVQDILFSVPQSSCPLITNLSHLSLSRARARFRLLLHASLSLARARFLSFSLSHSTDRLACGHHVVELLYFHLNSRRIPPILGKQNVMANRRLKRKISISIDPHAPMAQRSRPARCLDSLHSTCLHFDPPASLDLTVRTLILSNKSMMNFIFDILCLIYSTLRLNDYLRPSCHFSQRRER